MSNSSDTADLTEEQEHVTTLYKHLDTLREEASAQLTKTLLHSGGTPADRSHRDSASTMYSDRVAQYGAVENGLCFGRLDFADGERRYIGRIGIFDEHNDYEPLLVDWRAPASRPFYLATAAAPDGVRRRRHIRTERRRVTALDDEVLDLDEIHGTGRGAHDGVTGEAALLSALNASRTGRMKDIVETIQAEQDHVIRADLGGVLVVQGGPGTGKTAVALHRAAYLLYTHRQMLSSRVVLIVGPNTTFLKYISQVLPSLAETGVLLGTVGDLFPGVVAHREEPAEIAEIKGRIEMVDVLAAAVRDRQRVPDGPLTLRLGMLDGDPVLLEPAVVEDARERARRSGKLHNLARPTFDTEIIHALSLVVADTIGIDPYADDPLGGDDAPGDPQILDEADLAEIRRELRNEPEVLGALDWLWPILTPQQLVGGLFATDARLAAAGASPLLKRSPRESWTAADVPLLDEAAELLGEDETVREIIEERRRRQRIAYAEGALEIAYGSRSIDLEDEDDPELLSVTDLLEADRLAERHDEGEALTPAERAAADRKWAFGHVIVDEAQELSPMAWRLLMRRCPSRSMTVVGDVAQTGDLGGAASWGDALTPYVGDRWRLRELTVNYRTPTEIMAVAARVLADIDPALEPPRSVREAGTEPWIRGVAPGRLGDALAEAVTAEAEAAGEGRLGVIVPTGLLGELAPVVLRLVPDAAVGDEPELSSRVVVLTVKQAKGLEFDGVVVVDPERIVAESPRGANDLYVALTRATQRLGILHPGALPDSLHAVVGM
ncbi:AAA family ATPase [Dactylosporangium roseum]|uniref:AAA family ATPase n=1 Tax=Dactylosporangium roseum TaxID=47989 RepID=A0ABY5YWI1_9ACTN|nr:ATP-binding domain-containing protein [Dactylosporangium roseum]UWZ33607.1 AAA family ATPase [Dactylosporangium roseum]